MQVVASARESQARRSQQACQKRLHEVQRQLDFQKVTKGIGRAKTPLVSS